MTKIEFDKKYRTELNDFNRIVKTYKSRKIDIGSAQHQILIGIYTRALEIKKEYIELGGNPKKAEEYIGHFLFTHYDANIEEQLDALTKKRNTVKVDTDKLVLELKQLQDQKAIAEKAVKEIIDLASSIIKS